jgi:hypothetical protein
MHRAFFRNHKTKQTTTKICRLCIGRGKKLAEKYLRDILVKDGEHDDGHGREQEVVRHQVVLIDRRLAAEPAEELEPGRIK